MTNKTKEFRQSIADAFIKSLEENPADWKKMWQCENIPQNGLRKIPYKGLNRLILSLRQNVEGWEDSRWYTFKQIKDNGWHLRKGSKHSTVEYWMPYDLEQHKLVSWKEVQAFKQSGGEVELRYSLRSRYYYVYNGCQIEGLPPMDAGQTKANKVEPAALIEKISSSMGVPITHDGGDHAYYQPSSDSIHLPRVSSFFTSYAYNATALHELSHATGHPSRLNRDLKGGFGSESYAYEELVAEISACFMSADLPIETTEEHIANHKAYVQSWIRKIKEQPETLIQAIKEAEKAAAFLEKHAGLIKEAELTEVMESSKEVQENMASGEVLGMQTPSSLEAVQAARPQAVEQVLPKQLNVIQGRLCTENTHAGRFVKNEICLSVPSLDPQDPSVKEVTIPIVASGSAAVSLLAHRAGDQISCVVEMVKPGQERIGYEIKKIDDTGLLLTATDKLLFDYIKSSEKAQKRPSAVDIGKQQRADHTRANQEREL